MEVEFKDVSNHYVGCKVEVKNDRYIDGGYIGTMFGIRETIEVDLFIESDKGGDGWEHISNCKPVLKSLFDLTDHELINAISPMQCGLNSLNGLEQIKQCAEITKFLLSKHYDLFNLIENGQAIRLTTNK